MKKILYLFLLIFILFQLSSCKKKKEQAEEMKNLEAIVTFISGDAYVLSETGILPAVIGNILKEGDSLKTASDSYIEILITGNSVIRMDENTELSIERLASVGTHSDISMSLLTGSIINKVEKIITPPAEAGSINYSIRTPSAAFGVRGTEFLVSSSETEKILLAVKSGKVRMIPHSDVIERLKGKAPAGDANIEAFIKLAEESFPVVTGGSEITITPDLSAEILKPLSLVEKGLDDLKNEKIPMNALHEIISSSSATAISEAEKTFALVKSIDNANLEKLKITDFMQVHDKNEKFKEVVFRTNPIDAKIYFDSSFIGIGSASALLAADRTVKVTVEHEKYEPFDKEFVISEITEKPYIITLKPREPARGYFEISVLPSDAEIYIGNSLAGRGMHTGSYNPGTRLNVSLQRKEYKTEELSVEIKEGETVKRNIALPVLLVPYTFDTGFDKVDTIIPAGRSYCTFVSSGNGFSVIDAEGKTLFKNNDAAATAPVFAGKNLLFVSENIFKAIDTTSWKEAGNIVLEQAPYSAPVVEGNSILINSGDSILVIDNSDFKISRKIKVPDSVVSYPYLSNNRILAVTDKGVLQVFGQEETPLSSIPVTLGNPGGVSIAMSNNLGYFASLNGSINAIDLQTGNLLWGGKFQPNASGELPHISASDRGIILFSNNTLKFFKPNGEEIKEIEKVKSFCLGENSLIYAASENGRITAYNPTTGLAVRYADTALPVESIVYKDGKIHAATENGKYVIINPLAFGQ
ncbi:MAG: FecR domain-containing protein [Spirochaetaceae bacterium]|nr:FecR domain-containing protein [Spirochaetaceae bacterium]